MQSVTEGILVRVQQILVLAVLEVAGRVERGREDAYAIGEVPAINVRRGTGVLEPLGENGEVLRQAFELDIHVRGADWETQADAVHMSAHQVLLGDLELYKLGRGLRLVATDPSADKADSTAGILTARYEIKAFVRPGNLARNVN